MLSGVVITMEATVGNALKISASGFTLVFLALVCLGIFITIISKVVGTIEGTKPNEKVQKAEVKQATQPVTQAANQTDTALIAAIIGAVSEETKMSVDKFTITSIEEKK